MSSEIAIKVENLSKCYQLYNTPRDRLKQFAMPRLRRLFGKTPRQYFQEYWALKNISFEVKKGETFGIIGRNGAGKSTLLQLLCGTLTPSDGTVEINGRVAALLELGPDSIQSSPDRKMFTLTPVCWGCARRKSIYAWIVF